jgi:hypothetical protein
MDALRGMDERLKDLVIPYLRRQGFKGSFPHFRRNRGKQIDRLSLHGLIERIPKSHRYRVTDFGLRTALFFTRTYARVIRPGLSIVVPEQRPNSSSLRSSFEALETAMDN